MATIEKHIESQVAGRPVEEVFELMLDGCECTQLSGLTDEYVNLEKLTAVGCGLTTLKGFPNLPNLKKLDLSSNQLADSDLAYLAGCPALNRLMLCGNFIKDLSGLEPLKAHKALRKLDLTSCPVSDEEEYREKVFEMLDQLIFLDGMDKDGQEDEDDSDNEDGLDGEEDEDGEGSEDEDEDDEDGAGAGADDDDDEDDEDGGEEDGEEDGHERGVKRKHEDEEDV